MVHVLDQQQAAIIVRDLAELLGPFEPDQLALARRRPR